MSERRFVVGVLADSGHLGLYQTVPELAAGAAREAAAAEEALTRPSAASSAATLPKSVPR